jgi:hypothetical protein
METSSFSPVDKTSLYDLDPESALEPMEAEQPAHAAALGGGMSIGKVLDPWADGFLARTDGVGTN